MPQIFQLKPSSRNISLVKIAKSLLSDEHVIAIPTDTIYGIAATITSQNAIQRLYQVKERNSCKPLAICVSDIEDIYKYSVVTVKKSLLKELLPGAVTVMFCRSGELSSFLNPNIDLVGIRVPDCNFVRDLCRVSGPIALTSANISNQSSCLDIEEFSSIWPLIDDIFDGGPLGHIDPHRLGSTIIDLSLQGHYRIIRNGCIYEQVLNTLHKYGLKPL